MENNEQENKNNIYITSNNQSGGITAHTVNFTKPKRELVDLEKQQLLEVIAKYPSYKVDIHAVMGNAEAFQYAKQIFDFLKSKGIEMPLCVGSILPTEPIVGQKVNVNHTEKMLEMYVGEQR